MNKADRVDAFINSLQALPDLENVFNPWKDTDPVHDNPVLDAPAIRRENLRRYLLPRVGQARWLLVAEAPGYNGCKFSGIAMTSERQLLTIPDRIGLAPECRVSTVISGNNPQGRTERTASIVFSGQRRNGKHAAQIFYSYRSCLQSLSLKQSYNAKTLRGEGAKKDSLRSINLCGSAPLR